MIQELKLHLPGWLLECLKDYALFLCASQEFSKYLPGFNPQGFHCGMEGASTSNFL